MTAKSPGGHAMKEPAMIAKIGLLLAQAEHVLAGN
jgi:hypothetical protein